ncbi:MAG: ubiquinone/menaquinone biosynthesis C-methylase UbiE [Hyphomicrobiaceae bacterium]|jgi:ubiquinone/menaquinone biosynthesis C-methylase UbiE
MGLYDTYVLPRLLDFAMRQPPIMRQREKIVPQASGRVLEIGIGSGLNLSYYDQDAVQALDGLEPSEELRAMARGRAAEHKIEVGFVGLRGEEIPVEDASYDTIVMTYTLCTIPDPERALAEMRRVLKPGGTLLFCEHGKAPDAGVANWQARINPIWKRFAGGCNLNREVPRLIEGSGFVLDSLETMYLPGPRPMSYNYWGRALSAA